MSEFFIKPAPGKLVRDPQTLKPLAESGESKPRNPFWLRRLNVGDVTRVDARVERKSRTQLTEL